MQQDPENVEQAVEQPKRKQHAWENVERGLYRDKNTGQFYERIRSGGNNTWLSLETNKKPEARERLDARRAMRAAQKLGLKVKDPSKKPVTISVVLDRFKADGFPGRKGHPRADTTQPEAAVEFLRDFFGAIAVTDLSEKLLDDYHDWRIKKVAKGDGHRTTDLDLQTLSVALSWAKRKDLIKLNPIQGRHRYTNPETVRHAKDVAPKDMAVVHKLAAKFFCRPNSEVVGWQLLFGAMTGARTEELLNLRSDAGPEEPGFVTKDGGTLYIRRVKKAARENPCIYVGDDLKRLLEAHKEWKAKRYPNCPWFFPGRDGKSVLSPGALGHALRKRKGKNQVTPHGLRALYVKVRRSNSIPDNQIAWELNHTSGTVTLEQIYGGVPPHWMSGKGPKLTWIPGRPAWEQIPR